MKTKKEVVLEYIKCITGGIIIGTVIGCYKYLITLIVELSKGAFSLYNLTSFIVGILFSLIFTVIGFFLIKMDGSIQNGGLHQLELNVASNKSVIKWYKALPLMIINSLITFFNGIPMGTEAPSVFIGGVIMLGTRDVLKTKDDKVGEDIAIGMGAGFASAVLSPLAGISYSFEEAHEKINLSSFLKTCLTCIVAFFISYLINPHFVISMKVDFNFYDLNSFVFPLILIINLGFALILIQFIKFLKTFINKNYKNFFIKYRYFILYISAISITILVPIIAYDGSDLFNWILEDLNITWLLLLIYFLYRLIAYIIYSNSSFIGGSLVPSLCLGAMSGRLLIYLLEMIPTYDSSMNLLVILLSTVTLFACINRTPITGFFMVLSFAGIENFNTILLPALVMMILVFIVTKGFKYANYNETLRNLLRTSSKEKLEVK